MPDAHPPRSLTRLEDARFLTGTATYSADRNEDGQAHAVFVRSDHAHAEITGIGIDDAVKAEGVLGVFTDDDLAADGLNPLPCSCDVAMVSPLVIPPRRALARGRVRHVGDAVVMVVAETRAQAEAAAELVEIAYAGLDPVVDAAAALEPGAPAVWDEAPGNLAFQFQAGDVAATRAAIDGAAHVVDLDLVNNRITAVPLEPRAGIGGYDPDTERYTLTFTGQGLHGIRDQIAQVFGLPTDSFHLKAPDVGGGFGLKNFIYPEWVLLPWAAKRLERPVKWVAERGEDFAAATHGRDMRVSARMALDAEGNFLALEADMVSNMGAYLSSVAPNIPTRSVPTAMGGVYAVPHIFMNVRGAFTNTAPVDAYRGAGKPEANYLMERLVEVAARRCGFDPVELRRKNSFHVFPHVTALGQTIDGGRFAANIDEVVQLIDRDGFEARRADAAARGQLRGLGIACFLETARAVPEEGAEVRFTSAGRIELCLGTESNGQGHETTFPQIAADTCGLPITAFDFIHADTDKTRMGHGHGGARSMHMGGSALVKAMDGVLMKATRVAAGLLQTDPDALTFADGVFTGRDGGSSISLMDVAAQARADDPDGAGLDTFAKVEDAPFTFPNGCHAAEVEIDPDTGTVDLVRYVTAEDYGRLLNPVLTAGQVHGGVTQGIGQALGEHAVYDAESGQLMSGSMLDYLIPNADRLPALEVHLENGVPTNANPLGVKGSGQAGAIAAPQTVMNAVADALKPLGIDHVDMPATPETVWRAIRTAAAQVD